MKYSPDQIENRRNATLRYRAKNADLVRQRNRDAASLRRLNPELRRKELDNQKHWKENNREHFLAYSKDYYQKNNAARLASAAKCRASRSPERIAADKAYQKAYRKKTAAKRKLEMKKWVGKNKEHVKQREKLYNPRRKELNKLRRLDPIQRLKDACRTRTLFILKKAGVEKFNHTFDLIGCCPNFFKAYLEVKFESGMNWGNHGTHWEIDHIIPLSSFDLSVRKNVYRAFNYSNCQPLWKIENRIKNCKFPSPHQAVLI